MPKEIKPSMPIEFTTIHNMLGVETVKNELRWFFGVVNFFSHPIDDIASFRMISTQQILKGFCRNCDIIRVFGVSKVSVIRAINRYKEGYIVGFFDKPKGRGAVVLTEKVVKECQALLDNDWSRVDIAEKLNIKLDTLKKGISRGLLYERNIDKSLVQTASSKSERSLSDSKDAEGYGVACSRRSERFGASLGMLTEASTKFERSLDVPNAGLLCSIPVLCANGLYRHLKILPNLPKGFYNNIHIITVLAFMYLTRIKSVERLRYQAPGEMGKLIGLDRAPEVKKFREKLKIFSDENAVKIWTATLAEEWMEANKDLAGTLYIDGHVSLYFGKKTDLPKRYVSRLRLCMRGNSFYYINDALGQPYFFIEKPVDPGMIETLKKDIIPKLLQNIPKQPSEKVLKLNPNLHRFILVFDREGYSPALFKELWNDHRIACMTYRKYSTSNWDEKDFEEQEVKMPNGEILKMKLAEKGVLLGKKKQDQIWVKEIRKLNEGGYQTSIISTLYSADLGQIAAKMFARWSQENFFKYMRENYDFDKVLERVTEELPDTISVINPEWKKLENQIRTKNSLRNKRLLKFAQIELSEEKSEKELIKTAELREEIEAIEKKIETLKKERKKHAKKIEINNLPEEFKFKKLKSSSIQFINTIKMIVYRAETVLGTMIKGSLNREQDARPIIQKLFNTEADILPDLTRKILEVRVHRSSTPKTDQAIENLLKELNDSKTLYPGTDMTLKYTLLK